MKRLGLTITFGVALLAAPAMASAAGWQGGHARGWRGAHVAPAPAGIPRGAPVYRHAPGTLAPYSYPYRSYSHSYRGYGYPHLYTSPYVGVRPYVGITPFGVSIGGSIGPSIGRPWAPPPPYSGSIWIAPRWVWNGYGWVWQPGYWTPPAY